MNDLTLLNAEEKDKVDEIMSMNRKERRSLGKQLKVKIPGSSVPIKYGNN